MAGFDPEMSCTMLCHIYCILSVLGQLNFGLYVEPYMGVPCGIPDG